MWVFGSFLFPLPPALQLLCDWNVPRVMTVLEFQNQPSTLKFFNELQKDSRFMRISLLRISLLRFFKKIHKFALCEFMPYALK